MTELVLTVLAASAAAFGLALLSAVAGFGGGVLLLPVFTVLFGLRVAVPMLTLTQLSSNGSRVWFNRRDLRWPLIGWFALGAVPFAVVGGLLLAHAPLAPLKRLLGVFLVGVVIWRRVQREPRTPTDPAFVAPTMVADTRSLPADIYPCCRSAWRSPSTPSCLRMIEASG